MEKLSENEIKQNLVKLPNWHHVGQAISRQFEFKDFAEAFNFMKLLAPKIDAINHHPDWSNSYNRLTISFTSHDADGLTQKDFDMAHLVDATLNDIS